MLATFRFAHRHKVTIGITDLGSGCEYATNGTVDRPLFNVNGQNPVGPRLEAELERLTLLPDCQHLRPGGCNSNKGEAYCRRCLVAQDGT